jgi:hypothetical protein
VDLAVLFEAPYIRMFSYYAPEGKNIDDYREQVMDRMAAKVEVLADVDVTMVHENEPTSTAIPPPRRDGQKPSIRPSSGWPTIRPTSSGG